ncbi:Vesicle membrane receptor protein (v-SNARE) [Basidiobolus ranarum]|uniref:Vesicle membrane receptor protein (V-SNARE) n=1 Tax=Basidiobolus ranarum TaxID=34480 RepID=A0ABR2WY78_9FUNG
MSQVKIQKVQGEINNGIQVMEDNLQAAQSLDDNFDRLHGESNQLEEGTKGKSCQVHKRSWWRNNRWTLVVIFVVLLIIGGIVAGYFITSRKLTT